MEYRHGIWKLGAFLGLQGSCWGTRKTVTHIDLEVWHEQGAGLGQWKETIYVTSSLNKALHGAGKHPGVFEYINLYNSQKKLAH